MTIQNIESYYNYRTIENDYKLVSSILSNENNFIEIWIKNNSSVQNRIYEIAPEIILIQNDFISNSNFSNLHLKKYRIKSALAKIKNKTAESSPSTSTNNNFFNYFSLSSDTNLSVESLQMQRP